MVPFNYDKPDAPNRQLFTDCYLLSLVEPKFVNGIIECEVELGTNAVFNIMIRGFIKRDFYMARLDTRKQYRDCILERPPGNEMEWGNVNPRLPVNPSPTGKTITMKVEAEGGAIRLFRNGDLVDSIIGAREEFTKIRLFAETNNVFVKSVAITPLDSIYESKHQVLIRQLEEAIEELIELNQNDSIPGDEWVNRYQDWNVKAGMLFLYDRLNKVLASDFNRATGGQSVSGKAYPQGRFRGEKIKGRDKYFLETLKILDSAVQYLKQSPEA